MEKSEPSIFWRNFTLVLAFFVLTPVALIASLVSLISMAPTPAKLSSNKITQSNIGVSVYASLPTRIPSISGFVTAADARPQIVYEYLNYYHSPLAAYSEEIVQVADKYGLDYRFIPAIAQQESNLCKIIPTGSYNCWGWGITSVSSLGFDSYSDGIETVTRGLKKNYIDDGLVTPEQIMARYTPQSNGSWAHGVNEFMAAMQ